MKALVVRTSFLDYEAGQMITDRAEIKAAHDKFPGYVVEVNHEPSAAKQESQNSADTASATTAKKSTSADLPAVKSPNAA